ncbi:short chain dehydrogenase/reductase family oxidoreductase [Fictibacillus macauensis ZFHKF-1]|uniref:Short chain dehydrogenase/reductase family oxidoreductase n=1 Tax=Fictibacillus macauensis ZFHKF-1 TaxID=1196324 RepID=I8AG76_9BACL|nr:SDR family oxidoreductase [Fictibacillus macauensis]EIT84667.1 short chain dehydrogenase/reductase family oxidoreductase [Fictibacillus macauensis ZFHKF-1]
MNLGLDGKKVLVTGGSKGLGLGIAKLFLEEGAQVGICGRNETSLQEAKQQIPSLEIFQGDVTNEQDRQALIDAFLDRFGTIDVLINNAGGSNGTDSMNTPLAQFEESLQLNFLSAVAMSKLAATTMMTHNEGVIVNISSVFGREAGGKPTYNASKAAMISFTKSLADELIGQGIRVCGVAPGSVLHPTGNWQKRLEENPEKIKTFVEQSIPAGRFGTVEEIANTVVFLASKRASWVSGATLNVDGGQSKSNF